MITKKISFLILFIFISNYLILIAQENPEKSKKDQLGKKDTSIQNETNSSNGNGVQHSDKGSMIVITGTRRRGFLKDSSIITEVITRKDIDAMGARDLSQTLGNVPGIEVRPAQAGERGETVRLQGLASQNVLILVDGQRTTGRFSGAIDLTRFKAEEIERIEIVKGASSAIYGSDAIAGVINIITREASSPISINFRTQGGTGSRQYFGETIEFRNYASLGMKKEKISTLFTVGWHKGEGYDLTKDATVGPRNGRIPSNAPGYNPYPYNMPATTSYFLATRNTGYTPPLESTSGSAFTDLNVSNKTIYTINDSLAITGQFYYRYLDQHAVDAVLPRTVYDRRNKTHDFMGALNADYALSKKWSLNLNTNYSRFQDIFTTDQRKADDLDTKQNTDNAVSEFRSRFDYKFTETHVISFGAETLLDQISSARIAQDCRRNFPNICIEDRIPEINKGQVINGFAERFRNAFFIQDEWRISDKPRIQIIPGIRYDRDSIYGGQWLPKLAIRYDISDNFRIRTASGLGYRAPSFQDLYFNFLNPGVGYRVAGNPDLKPELSRSNNLGFEWDITKKIWFSSNLFYNQIDNLIGFRTNPVRDASGLQVFQTSNYLRAETHGLETSFSIRLTDIISSGAGYTYTNTKDKITGLPLEGRGPHRWNLNFRADHKPSGFSFAIFAVVFGKQPYYCIKNPFWCNPDLPDNFNVIEVKLASDAQANIQNTIKVPVGVSDYCTERNLSYCTTNNTFGYKMVNAHTNLNLRLSQKFLDSFQWFVGVDNILDEWDLQYNPQRPRYYYFGIDGKFDFKDIKIQTM